MSKKQETNKGGSRPGAGRPHSGGANRYTVYISDKAADFYEAQTGTASRAMKSTLETYFFLPQCLDILESLRDWELRMIEETGVPNIPPSICFKISELLHQLEEISVSSQPRLP